MNTSPPTPLNGLSSYFQGMFPQTPSCASSHYFFNMSVRLSVNQLSLKKLMNTSFSKPSMIKFIFSWNVSSDPFLCICIFQYVWTSVIIKKKLVNTSRPKSLIGLRLYFHGMFLKTPSRASNSYFLNISVCQSVN